MLNTRRLMVAGATAMLIAGLAACGGGQSGAEPPSGTITYSSDSSARETTPRSDSVSGLRDTVRHLSVRTVKATRPHMVKKCTSSTRRVRHTASSGTGTKRKTRTWYTTERTRTCKNVRTGTETYRRVVRPERWCVRLDDVGGDKTKDDIWFRVSSATYHQALAAKEHTRLEFVPQGSAC
ncbi:hypothetical protein [Streptomyces sp. NPDC001286]